MDSVNRSLASTQTSLTQALERRARAASSLRLAIDVIGGQAIVTAMTVWQPRGWPIFLCVGLAFMAFGLWALADRELAGTGRAAGSPVVIILIAMRTIAVSLGALAVFVLLFGTVGVAMGTWIE